MTRRRRTGGDDEARARRLLDARRSSTTRSSPPSRRRSRGQGRRRHHLVRRLRRAEPRGRGRPAGRRRLLLDRAGHRAPGEGRASSPPTGPSGPTTGLVNDLARHLHRAQGQPEGHPHLERPAEAGRRGADAEPVHLRLGQVEPARRVRPGVERRQGPAGRPRLREEAPHEARQGPGQVRARGAAGLHLRQRRRAALLRVRGDHRAEEGPGRRLRDALGHDPDRHPDRRRRRPRRTPRPRRRSSTTRSRRPRSRSSPTGATGPSTRPS